MTKDEEIFSIVLFYCHSSVLTFTVLFCSSPVGTLATPLGFTRIRLSCNTVFGPVGFILDFQQDFTWLFQKQGPIHAIHEIVQRCGPHYTAKEVQADVNIICIKYATLTQLMYNNILTSGSDPPSTPINHHSINKTDCQHTNSRSLNSNNNHSNINLGNEYWPKWSILHPSHRSTINHLG